MRILAVVSFLVLLTIGFLPFGVKKIINSKGDEFSKVLSFSVKDVGYSLNPLGMELKEAEVLFKKTGHKLATVKSISYGIMKNETIIDEARSFVTDELYQNLNGILVKRPEVHGAFVPKVINVELKNSEVVMEKFKGVEGDKFFTLKNMEGHLKNFRPGDDKALVDAKVSMNFTPKTLLKVSAKFNPLDPKSLWDVDGEVKNILLLDLNEILKNKTAVKFEEGKASFYFEAVKDSKSIHGYVKPIFENVRILKTDEDIDGSFFIRLIGQTSKIFFDDKKARSIGTKIPFHVRNHTFEIDTSDALDKFLDHAKGDEVKSGLDHQYSL